MRNFAVSLAVATTLVTSLSSAARAEDSYVAPTAAVITSDHLGGVGLALEGGHRIAESSWFAHGKLAAGTVSNSILFGDRQASLWQARAGVEDVTCNAGASVCARAGVDLGWQHTRLDLLEGVPFEDQHVAMTSTTDRPIVAARAAVDLRVYRAIHFRPGAEVVADHRGYSGVAVGAGWALSF